MEFGDERLGVVGIGGTLREGSTRLGALRRALEAGRDGGAETELLELREMNLSMYEPGRPLDDYGPEVERLIEALREADALILGAAAYHGTLAGVTKNALDFAQFLARDERPYLEDRVVGLISTAGGEQAAAHTTDAMVHIVHALRGVVAPLVVTIPRAWQRSDDEGNITDERYGGRLDRLGRLVVEMAGRMNLESGRAEAVGVAV